MREITPAMVYRYEKGETGLHAPCIICGVTFSECPHDVWKDTAPVIHELRLMGKEGRRALCERKA